MTHLNQTAPAVARGDRDRAGELLGRAQATLDQLGVVPDPADAFEVGWLRDQLG